MQRLWCLAAILLTLEPLAAAASSIDKTMVRRVIAQRQAEYQKCYMEALSRSPDCEGRLLLSFTVEADGSVSSAAERSTSGEKFSDERLAGCVADQFRKLRFPRGPSAFRIVYPMIFRPGPGENQ